MVNWFNRVMDRPDLGKLILRLAFSIMMIFHGWHKLFGGIDYIQGLLTQHGYQALSVTAFFSAS